MENIWFLPRKSRSEHHQVARSQVLALRLRRRTVPSSSPVTAPAMCAE